MSDERFYSEVRNLMQNYRPEVPQQTYHKMRRALWWSQFTKLSATRFNMWYLLLLIGAGGGALAWHLQNDTAVQANRTVPSVAVYSGQVAVEDGQNASQNKEVASPVCTLAKETCAQKTSLSTVSGKPNPNGRAKQNLSVGTEGITNETHELRTNAHPSDALLTQMPDPEVSNPTGSEDSREMTGSHKQEKKKGKALKVYTIKDKK